MDWFKRHLNWTMFIVWIGVPFLLLLIGEAIGNSEITLLCVPWLLVILITACWVLHQKGRSWAWILLGGIGLFITFCLENKRVPKKSSDTPIL